MNRSLAWFLGAAAFVVVALGAATWAVLDLERQNEAAAEEARQQAAVGQALLRLDIALGPVLAGEAARWLPRARAASLPDDSFARGAPFLDLYFEVAPDGTVTSPSTALDGAPDPRLAGLVARLGLGAEPAEPGQVVDPAQQSLANNSLESFEGRSQIVGNYNRALSQRGDVAEVGAFVPWLTVEPGPAPQLAFIRHVRRSAVCKLQGMLVDWPALQAWLREQIVDLLPQATFTLEHAPIGARLASVPVALAPGPLPPGPPPATGSMRYLLVGVWVVVLLALGVVGVALRAAVQLGERRALFVSSVTHELRTPLTTFRMYAQMLADGMVPEASRGDYLATLRDESERLQRIVESVLLYARLEDGRGGAHRRTVAVAQLWPGLAAALRQRAADAGRQLAAVFEGEAAGAVHVDPQAVEQILGNLVDNAVKYAPPGEVLVTARAKNGELVILVRDPGPGLPAAAAAALFEPFQRGAAHREGAIPGLGLGLAIARGLARAMGGELELVAGEATTFRLRLPWVGPDLARQ